MLVNLHHQYAQLEYTSVYSLHIHWELLQEIWYM